MRIPRSPRIHREKALSSQLRVVRTETTAFEVSGTARVTPSADPPPIINDWPDVPGVRCFSTPFGDVCIDIDIHI